MPNKYSSFTSGSVGPYAPSSAHDLFLKARSQRLQGRVRVFYSFTGMTKSYSMPRHRPISSSELLTRPLAVAQLQLSFDYRTTKHSWSRNGG